MTKQPRKVPSFDWGDINKKRFSNVEAEALFSASNPGLHLRKQDIIAYCEGFQQRRVFGRCVDAKRKCDSYASRQVAEDYESQNSLSPRDANVLLIALSRRTRTTRVSGLSDDNRL
ncbi:hypothetical protein Tco_0551157 [Tanacetum coccineum]